MTLTPSDALEAAQEEIRHLRSCLAQAEGDKAAAEARGREQGLRMAADRFAALAEATPLGAENKERGASVYNWTRWAEKQVRALIPAPPPADGDDT